MFIKHPRGVIPMNCISPRRKEALSFTEAQTRRPVCLLESKPCLMDFFLVHLRSFAFIFCNQSLRQAYAHRNHWVGYRWQTGPSKIELCRDVSAETVPLIREEM